MACYFISYNSADLDWAEWVAWQLEDSGHTTIIQDWDFAPGSNFPLKMDEAAAIADKIIAVLSPNYLDAMYTQPEWAAAFAKDPTGAESKLIPVRVKECTPKGLLRQIIYIDLVGLDEERAKEELLRKIQAERLRPKVAPSFPGALSENPQPEVECKQDKAIQMPLSEATISNVISSSARITPPTDFERVGFINESFEKLVLLLEQHMGAIKKHNPGVEYTVQRVDARKVLVSTYFHGTIKYRLKAWLSNDFGTVDSIKLSYGRNVTESGNSCNEEITVEEVRGELLLKPLMNMAFSGEKLQTVEEIVAKLMDDLPGYFR